MKKKGRMVVFLFLICVGVIGILILKDGQKEQAALAIQDQETIAQDNINQAQEEQGQPANSEEEVIDVDSQNPDSTVDDGNIDKVEQINDDESVTNVDSQHIDINMEEIIALVGEDVYNFDSEKISQVEGPSSIFVLVNKKNNLPSDYTPEDLVVPNVPFSFEGNNPKKQMREEAAAALELLFKGATDQGLNIYAVSGYRSYNRQEVVYNGNVSSMGEDAANRVSAKPGQSEHQTGLAMDISCQSVGFDLSESFGVTEEGIWLAGHAHEYGFIIRYPQDKIDITQYNYEPWHVRYVGVTLAMNLYESNLTLDQFYEQLAN